MKSRDICDQLTTPVAFFIFRRPDTTRRVLEAIARVKPPVLYVIADGPRDEQDTQACAETRALVEQVNWDCQVVINYADYNLGLKKRFSTGLNWLFEQVEEAIILEDDCLPDDSFFRFCQELLQYYRNDPRVMHIGGNCFVQSEEVGISYYFTHFPHIWGWATWRRAWKLYDGDLIEWNTRTGRKDFLAKFDERDERQFWAYMLKQVSRGFLNTWDYQWTYTCIRHDGLAINPTVNLVSNIGFNANATNTIDAQNSLAEIPVSHMIFPLKHPSRLERDKVVDRKTALIFFTALPLWKQAPKTGFRIVKRIVANIFRNASI